MGVVVRQRLQPRLSGVGVAGGESHRQSRCTITRSTKFPSDERPGASVFYKNETGEVFHTYSSYGRGLDILVGAYHFLDLAPKGRDEDGLAFSMAWVRHHDQYDGAVVDTKASYQQPKSASCCD